MTKSSRRLSIEFIALIAVTAIVFVLLFVFLPSDLALALLVVALVAFLYFGIAVALAKYKHRTPDWLNTAPLWLVILVPVAIGVSLLFRYWADATLLNVVFVLGMMFMFLYYWLMVPFALVQKIEEQNWDGDVDEWPDLSVLVPAFQERGHISRTLDSIAASTYPGGIELIVVDDGSLDGTYEEAKAHAGTDAKVIRKENGGKHFSAEQGVSRRRRTISSSRSTPTPGSIPTRSRNSSGVSNGTPAPVRSPATSRSGTGDRSSRTCRRSNTLSASTRSAGRSTTSVSSPSSPAVSGRSGRTPSVKSRGIAPTRSPRTSI